MLDQLVESKSNSRENKRRSEFIVATLAIMVTTLVTSWTYSLFAKDFGMGGDDLSLTTLVAPVPPDEEPPPKPVAKTDSGGVLNGKAVSLPKPAYPPAAKAVRAGGSVSVQVLIDEEGRVVSASAVSGHPLLQQAAVAAARGARFSPTLLSGQ